MTLHLGAGGTWRHSEKYVCLRFHIYISHLFHLLCFQRFMQTIQLLLQQAMDASQEHLNRNRRSKVFSTSKSLWNCRFLKFKLIKSPFTYLLLSCTLSDGRRRPLWKDAERNSVDGKKSFRSTDSDTEILQSIYFAYKVGIISSYSNRMQKQFWTFLSPE